MKMNTSGTRVINPEKDFIPGTTRLKASTPHDGTFKKTPSKTDAAVRQYMVNKGMDNAKIGFANNQVTYDGKPFMTPSYVNDGTSYATPSMIDRAAEAYNRNNATVGVRSELEKQGFNTSLLDWNAGNGTFSFGGKEYKPDKVEDGKSFMTQENFDKFTGDMGLVKAIDYIPTLGLGGGAVMTQDGNLSYLGKSVPVYQVKSDGQNTYAYVKKEDLDRIANEYKLGNPTVSGAYEHYKGYEDRIDKALRKIENQKDFEYDVEDDPNYQAYLEIAKRNAEDSYEDTLARAAAMTGGFASSNAIVAANQAKDAHFEKLQDQIPQFFNNAYERYNAERQREFDRLSSVLNTANNQFSNNMQAAMYFNQLQKAAEEWNRIRKQDETEQKRYDDNMAIENQRYADEKAWKEKVYADENARYDSETEYSKRMNDVNILMTMYSYTKNPNFLMQAMNLMY